MEVSTSNTHNVVTKFIIELQNMKHNTDIGMNWNLLFNIMSTSIRDQFHDHYELITQVKETLTFLLSSEQLSLTWTTIIFEFVSKSQTAAKKSALQLAGGYRKISNFFQVSDAFPMNVQEYVQCVVESLLCYCNICHDRSSEMTAVTAIILLLPSDFHVHLFDSICRKPEKGRNLIEHLPSDFVLHTAYLLLRRKHSARTSVLSENEEIIFRNLVERALVDCYPVTVIDTLFMQKPFDGTIAKLIVNLLPKSCYVDLLDIVGSLWGERLFVSKGDGFAQEFLTVALITTLKKISGDQLSRRGNQSQPIAAILSAGVSTYLDQSDQDSRLRGMKIAKEFSTLLNHEISFEELDKHEMQRQQHQQQYSEKYDSTGICGTEYGEQISFTYSISDNLSESSKVRSKRNIDYDSSDSEIEGYEMPTEDSIETVKLTNYLRNCLEIFLAPDTDQDAYDKQLTALLSIPKVVLTQPADAGDVSGPLIRELLRLNNRFDTENFDELRSNAIQALLVAYPNLVAPVLCWAVKEEALTLSLRCFAISSLSKAAYTLSAVSPSQSKQLKSKDTENEIKENLVRSKELVHDSEGSSKTTVKRALKLKLLKSPGKVTSFQRNNFGAVSHLFFYPILHTLAVTIANNSSNKVQNKNDLQEMNVQNLKITVNPNITPNEEPFIRNSMTAKTLKSDSKVKLYDEEEGDGMYSMIPVEALLALAAFTKCSVNTVSQSTFTAETMKAAFMMKDSSSLSIRRASVTALFTAFESWLHLKKRMKQFPPSSIDSPSNGVLGSLTDVTGQLNRSTSKGERSLLEKEEYSMVVTIVDWAVLSSKEDPDLHCRTLKLEVVRLAIEAFELLDHEDEGSCST